MHLFSHIAYVQKKFPSFQDGLISFSELMIVMYVMSSGTPEENLRRIFRVFDANGDGHVTRFNL